MRLPARPFLPFEPLPKADVHDSYTILVVEKDPDVTDLLSAVLESEGHHVYSARNGAEALALALRHLPDAIFSGIELPDFNGYVLAARVRSTAAIATCLLVALTGRGRESDVELGKGVGFDHFLVKPASIEAILATLTSVRPRAAAPSASNRVG